MLKNISSTFFVMVVAMLSSFVVTILLGRTLSSTDFGEFTLLKQILLIGSTVAVFGLDYSYIKNYANKNVVRKTHFLSLSIFAVASAIFIGIVKFTYALNATKLVFIYLCVFFGATNYYIASIQRLKNRFFLAQLFAHGWKLILLVLVGWFLASETRLEVSFIYPLLTLSLFIGSSYMIKYLFSEKNLTSQAEGVRQYLTFGVMFWLINSTGLISGGIDKLVIPLIYGRDTLGNYAAVSFLFLISLTMIGSAIGYVIFPKISSGETLNVKKWSLVVLSICVSAILVYQFIGLVLVSILFSGKYDTYVTSNLILIFSIIGALQIIHTILHFVISAKGTERQLLIYWGITLLFILLFTVLLYLGRVEPEVALQRVAGIVLITRFAKIISMVIFLRFIPSQTANDVAITPSAAEVR